MMKRPRRANLTDKLLALIAGTSAIALLLAGVTFGYHQYELARVAKVEQLTTLADVVCSGSVKAIEANDPAIVRQMLDVLRLHASVESAAIYRSDGTVFASSELTRDREGNVSGGTTSRLPLEFSGYRFSGNVLEVYRPILAGSRWVGSVRVRAATRGMMATLLSNVSITAPVLLISICVALFIALRLQHFVTQPLRQLAEAARTVSSHHDYSLRVDKKSNDEIGRLCDGFNRMLEQIEIAEYMLQQANDELELRVEERTAQLDHALVKAEEASQAKSDFLARMSHEIRTPMNAMLGFAENLLDDSLDEDERRDAVHTIRRNGQHLLAIINDLLDLSKIEAGKFNVARSRCSPRAIVADVVSLMRARAGERQLAFAARFDGRLPESIETDPQLLRQILINLAANAIKFTDRGSVTLTTRLVYSELGDPVLQFAVTDTGIGMTAEQCRMVFDPFTQGDETMSRRYGGTGLGLPISRRLAQMLGGDITVTSRPNVGSTFTMEVDPGPLDGVELLDASQCELETRDRHEPRGSRQVVEPLDCRILLAEDGLDNQRLIEFILKKAGAEVTLVENGQAAIEAALAARDVGWPFDVILMDMQMPVRDGYSATAELRRRNYTGQIIALTAHAMSGAREKCLDAGCDDYTAKPIDRAELLVKIKASVQLAVGSFQQQSAAIE